MRIAQVCPRYYPHIGGVEEHVRNISERLAKNHDVVVYTTDPSNKLPKEEVISGIKVKRFKSWAPSEAYYFSGELKRHLVDAVDDVDIVHAHSYHAFPALYAAQTKRKNKLIFTPHYTGGGQTFLRNILHVPYRFLVKEIFEKADKVICVSKHEKNLLSKSFGVDPEFFVHIPNGIDLNEFRGLRKERKSHRIILSVARLEKYKGVHFLIKALQKLGDETCLEVVGKGPYKSNLVNLSRKLGIDNKVRFYQDLQRKELLQKYAEADLFALVSKYEAMPISLAEALASLTPCLVTNLPFLKEWIDNENCFGIDYPIHLGELVNLISKVSGTQVKGVSIPDWNDVVGRLEQIYASI